MTAYDDAVLVDNPVAFWPLDETSGTTAADATGNGHDGTYNGSVALATATVHGRTCPTFDGVDDYVSLPAINIATGGAYTVEAVARADVIVAESEIISERYLGGSDGVLASIGIKIGTASTPGQITAGSYSGGEGSPAWTWHVLEHEPWTVGDSHHLAYTHDGTTARFYVDGVLVDSETFALFGSTSAWNIGRKYDGAVTFNGAIAAVALYPSALTAGQIADHVDALTAVAVEGAVAFSASANLSVAAEVETSTAAVAFTVEATLAVVVDAVPQTAAVAFGASATFEVATRPVGVRRRLVVVDIHGQPFGELENATVGAISYKLGEPEEFSFVLPVADPKAHLLFDEKFREVQVWRGDQLLAWGPTVRPSADKANLGVSVKGVLWYLTRRNIGKASRTNYVPNGDFEAGTAGWRIGALSPFEPLANRGPELFTVSTPTDRALTGTRSLRLEQLDAATPKYGIQASTFLVWSVDPSANPEGDTWSLVARCFIPSADWLGPPPDGVGIRLDRFSTTTTIQTQPEGGGPVEFLPAPIESAEAKIDDNTPRDVWVKLEATLHAPVTGQPEFVQVTLGCPVGGVIYWDRAALTLDEGLRFYGVDQATIAAEVIEHLQDPAYGKSDLNLSTEMPPTGVLRDRVYLHHEHQSGADVLGEFATLDNGFDLSVAYTSDTRTIRTHHPRRGVHRPGFALELGRNVADFAYTLDGENAASSVIVLGTGDGSDREEASASNPSTYSEGLILETVFSAPPETPIDSLDNVAAEALNVASGPELLSVTTTPVQPGQRDPVGVLWPGDTVPVSIRAGALDVVDTYRVVEVTINPDDTLDLTLNRRDLS